MMWHEARKQERKIRGLMVDYKKRAERRREYYEKIKQDPTQFLRVYGRPYKIHLDPAVALSAESPQSMMPWQGQTDNMIDRFDVRAHLDHIPEYKSVAPPLPMTKEEEEEERKCSYERYRTLVENECAALTEEQCLHQIYLDEQFGPIRRTPDEEKKKLAEKKAAIGFTYEDNNVCQSIKEEEEDDDDSSDTDVETADLDVTLDVDALTPDQLKMLNQCAQQYGMKDDDYVKYLRKDKEELEALRQAKLLEEEKAQFAGRKSRRERRAYKEKKLQGRKISPPSYAARASPKYEPYKRSSSSSKSRSRSPENAGKVMYITSFGGESEEDAGVLQGPSLPPDLRNPSNRDNKGSAAGGNSRSWKSSRSDRKPSVSSRYRHRNRSPIQSSRKNRWLGGKRSRSRSRSASRSRSRSNPRQSHGNSYRLDRRRRSRSRSRSKSKSREWKRSHSSYHSSDSRGSRNVQSRYQQRRRYSRSRSRSRSSNSSRSRSSRSYSSSSSSRSPSRSRSRSKTKSPSPHNKTRCDSKSKSPAESAATMETAPKPVVKRYRRTSLSSSAEDSKSDSESGKSPALPSSETASNSASIGQRSKGKDSRVPAPNVLGKATLESQTSASSSLTPQEKLRRRMQAALNRQYKADKKAELQKLERVEQERQDREDELRSRVMEMRRRERERRHRELEEMERDRYSQKYSNSSDSDDWSHSRSPPYHSRRSRSWSPRWSRSRSRSRSRDRGLVDY